MASASPRRRPVHVLPPRAALAAAVVLAACAPPRGAPSPTVLPTDVRPDPAWTLRTLDGETFTLGDLRGRPVFVNLWASWCPPCVAEMASIGRLAERVGQGVAFVLASPEDEAVVREFVRRHPPGVEPVLEETLAPEALGAAALPHTVILDVEGRIVLSHRGAAAWDTPEVIRLLEALRRGG